MFIFSQKTGNMSGAGIGSASIVIGIGYSGTGDGKNNPEMEAVRMIGPLPRGDYEIGPIYDTLHLGPRVMPLTPIGHDALGRSGFFIHGDNAKHDASHGCIILPRGVRELIGAAGDRHLRVV